MFYRRAKYSLQYFTEKQQCYLYSKPNLNWHTKQALDLGGGFGDIYTREYLSHPYQHRSFTETETTSSQDLLAERKFIHDNPICSSDSLLQGQFS